MKTRAALILSLTVSIGSVVFFLTGVPFIWQAVVHQWKPSIEASLIDLIVVAALLFAPLCTIIFLRRHPEEKKKKIGLWAGRLAMSSLAGLVLSITLLVLLHYLPARRTGEDQITLIVDEKKPDQASGPTAPGRRGSP